MKWVASAVGALFAVAVLPLLLIFAVFASNGGTDLMTLPSPCTARYRAP